MKTFVKHSILSLSLIVAMGCDDGTVPGEGVDGLVAPGQSGGQKDDPAGGVNAAGGSGTGGSTSDNPIKTQIPGGDGDGDGDLSGDGDGDGSGDGDGDGGTSGDGDGDGDGDSGTGGSQAKGDLFKQLAAVADLDATSFAARTDVDFEELGYDPAEAAGLQLIQDSGLSLTDAELEKYKENGFVISKTKLFPHFTYGYQSLYTSDLPLYISADSILYALHSSYDEMLKSFEGRLLYPEVEKLLTGLRANLEASDITGDTHDDLDIFLTIATSLLTGEAVAPAAEANLEAVTSLTSACIAGSGKLTVPIFGKSREVDFSQCTPRGHYTESAVLQRYFRAMIWLGRIDFRLMEPPQGGALKLNRRQVEATVALRTLMDGAAKESYQKVDALITAFVGEHDYMTPPQVDALMSDLNVTSLADLDGISDEVLESTIVDGGYGAQRISSHVMVGGIHGTAPLSASFALLGQRYVIDSHVFSNVVFDRVKEGEVLRWFPDPLDVAYAALQNDQAGMLLEDELATYDYASDLASMRTVVDSEPDAFWEQNLYNRWLGAIRTLSPAQSMIGEAGEGLPQVAKTEAWGRRILNTQLASWAELRHDTILYTKQSYTGGGTCEYPDAYVDPYPAFFAAITDYAQHALVVLAEQGFVVEDTSVLNVDFDDPNHFSYEAIRAAQLALENFVKVGTILTEMAEAQRSGMPHSEEHLAFVNGAVSVQAGCTGPGMGFGWYPDLFINKYVEFSPTIADVHTQPTDPSGGDLGRILHVGTGEIRLMVTSVETCMGPRAYAGLVSSYYEHEEYDWKRLNDAEWEALLSSEDEPQSPEWFTPITATAE